MPGILFDFLLIVTVLAGSAVLPNASAAACWWQALWLSTNSQHTFKAAKGLRMAVCAQHAESSARVTEVAHMVVAEMAQECMSYL